MSEFIPGIQESQASRAHEQMAAKLGAEGMAMLDEQLGVYTDLNERPLESPLRDALRNGSTELPAGTLLHGMGMHGFSEEAVEGVAERGIVSGELIGMTEDSETHGCADFFRTAQSTTVGDYFAWSKERVQKSTQGGTIHMPRGEQLLSRSITFIVDPQAEGMDALLQKDGYRDEAMSGFVHPPDGRSAEDTAAILGGVPKGAIAGIVASDRLLGREGVLPLLANAFPGTPVLSQEGVLRAA